MSSSATNDSRKKADQEAYAHVVRLSQVAEV